MKKIYNNFKLNPVIKDGRFFNPNENCNNKKLYEYLILIHSFFHEIVIFIQSFINWHKRAPKDYSYWQEKNTEILNSSINPNITWIGHATFLIQMGGKNIITDPIFGSATIFFPRIFAPAIEISKLPKIDYIIISHNHMDRKSIIKLKMLNPDVKFLVPVGNKNWFDKRNISNVSEYHWWQEYFEDELKFTFLPAKHWSQRNLFDQNKSLWGSWMIENNGFNIYFAGDTAYSNHFKLIADEFKNIDIALMPIGPCEPREKMCHSHINASEAGQAFLELNAKEFIPMHWGTFHFGTDLFDTPIVRIKQWWNANQNLTTFKKLNIVKFGQRLEFNINQPSSVIDSKNLQI
jgi:L-ascorbate metabolism protein UlaG (beta-lactamase superfamily)